MSSKQSVVSGGLADDFNRNTTSQLTEIVVGYIGQIIKSKGIENYLKLASLNPSFKFVIAGDGPLNYVSQLKEEFNLQNVIWKGRVNASEFYPSISMLVVPSIWHEPLARVLYESLSFGIPVIASDVGGNPDVLSGNLSKFIFKSADIVDMNNKFQICVHDIENNLIDGQSLIEVSKEYLVQNVSKKYYSVYKECIEL